MPQLRAAAVGRAALAVEVDVLHAPLAGGQFQLRGLAVDEGFQILKTIRQTQGRRRPGAVGVVGDHVAV